MERGWWPKRRPSANKSRQPTDVSSRLMEAFRRPPRLGPDSVTLIIPLRRAMIRLLLRQQGCSLAEPMFERLGGDFDGLSQRHVH